MRAYLRSLNPDLPRSVWILQAGGLANAFGNGVVLPFVIIYLHNVRGIPLWIAGMSAAANAGAGIVSGAVGGALADRFGPRRILMTALVGQAAVISCFPFIDTAWHALALQFAMGAFSGMFWPSQSSLLTTRLPSPKPEKHDGPPGTYRAVLANRPFRTFLVINMLFIAAGIVPLVEFMPVYAKNGAGVSEDAIGVIFFVNTLFIVLAQLPIAKALEGRRRMPAFALMGVTWAATWVVVVLAVETMGATAAALVIGGAVVVFALGECLHGTVQGPLVADLAEPRMMGRYMALSSLSWQVGFLIGPAFGGAILDAQPVALWIVCAGICLAGAAWSLAFERSIPADLRSTPKRRPEQILEDVDVLETTAAAH